MLLHSKLKNLPLRVLAERALELEGGKVSSASPAVFARG